MAKTSARNTARHPLVIDPAREHRVRERAYFLWESDGKPHGRDVEYWERAREIVADEDTAGSAEPPPAHQGAAKPAPPPKGTAKAASRATEKTEAKEPPPAKRKARAKTSKS